jgi:MerR family redox-sensitive transcriptional activator SoxR
VALIELAKRLGFSLAETRVFLSGLSERVAPPQVWEQLARRKLPDVERKLEEAQAMKLMLEEGLRCECISLQACVGWAPPSGRFESRSSSRT